MSVCKMHQRRCTWNAAFDRDPIGRERSGVRRYRILRPIDDPNYITIDLEFDSSSAAEAALAALREVWRSPAAAPALAGNPQTKYTRSMCISSTNHAGR